MGISTVAGYCGVLLKVFCVSIGGKRRGGAAVATDDSAGPTTRILLRGVVCPFAGSLGIV